MARTADDVRTVSLDDRRVPPQNLEAEESVLGSMMLSAEAIADVVEILDTDDFYRSANAKIYATLRGLYARGEPVDIITGIEALRAARLPRGGRRASCTCATSSTRSPRRPRPVTTPRSWRGPRFVADSSRPPPTSWSWPTPAPRTPSVVADDAEQRIYDVARRDDREDVAVLRDLVNEAMVDLESIQNRDSAFTGIPTGFVDLDNLMSGLQPGNLIVIAARPGIGKSSLAMNIARNIAVDKQPVAMFSLEMSRMEIGMRLLCAEARVPWDRIRNKRVGPDDWQRVVHAAEILHDAPVVHRRLGQRQHRRHPRQGPPHALVQPRACRSSSSTTCSS